MRRSKRNIVIGIVAAGIGLAGIGGPVLASGIGSNDDQSQRQQEFEQALAAKLGVPQEAVSKPLTEAQAEQLAARIDELAQAGTLTPAEATTIKTQITNGDFVQAMQSLRSSSVTQRLDELVTASAISSDQSAQIASLVGAGVPIGIGGPKPGEVTRLASAAELTAKVRRGQQAGALSANQATDVTALIAAGRLAEADSALLSALAGQRLDALVAAKTITQEQSNQIAELIDSGAPITVREPQAPAGQSGQQGQGGQGTQSSPADQGGQSTQSRPASQGEQGGQGAQGGQSGQSGQAGQTGQAGQSGQGGHHRVDGNQGAGRPQQDGSPPPPKPAGGAAAGGQP